MLPGVMATRTIHTEPAHQPKPPRHPPEHYRVNVRARVNGAIAQALRERRSKAALGTEKAR
jgi:hypothetical protein